MFDDESAVTFSFFGDRGGEQPSWQIYSALVRQGYEHF